MRPRSPAALEEGRSPSLAGCLVLCPQPPERRRWQAPDSEWVFFFQAEDGIRDSSVTGVQTCALPISDPDPGGDPLDLGSCSTVSARKHSHSLEVAACDLASVARSRATEAVSPLLPRSCC